MRGSAACTALFCWLTCNRRFDLRIPREEVTQFEKIIRRVLHDLDPELIFEICGSYRRGKATCGDIDVLVTHTRFSKSLDGMLDSLVEYVSVLWRAPR